MSRIIKFRAWNFVAKEMHYPENAGNVFLWQKEGQVQEIMQFTGLRDKIGKEIYEGDICKTYNIYEPSKLVDTVVFDEGSFVFQNDYKLTAELRGFKTDYIEVIGNIFENPELIK